MLLSSIDHREIARKAHFLFEVNFGLFSGDSVLLPGDGVDDLDQLISKIESGTFQRMKLSVDMGRDYAAFRNCDLEDLKAIRAAYVGLYGAIAKLGAIYRPPAGFGLL